MAGGSFVPTGEVKQYAGKITGFVIITCIVAAFGGLIFGYDIGVSGGVTSMDAFLKQFFPSIYSKQLRDASHENQYCKFDSQLLTMFTSSLYIAGLLASFFASTMTRICGRIPSMIFGGVTFLIGSAVNGAAKDVAMLIVGRLLLGVGVGFANQSVPVYLSEMAPAKIRGALNVCFQLAITIGIFAANLVNYGTSKIQGDYGWRISLALAAVPAIMMLAGAAFLPETPNSLIERGQVDKAKTILQKIRGTADVDSELDDLVAASDASKQVENPWTNMLQKKYRPQLVMSIAIPMFQQLTGINVIMFYSPVLFKTLGFGDDASLMSAVISGLVNVIATFVSIGCVDKFGRRALFLQGGVQMFISQVKDEQPSERLRTLNPTPYGCARPFGRRGPGPALRPMLGTGLDRKNNLN
ncbi:unnamed protein product [Victoria cruziana]